MNSRSLIIPTLILCYATQQALARGVTPYLPLNLSPDLERDVERVLVLADKAVLKRPIPAAVVFDALPDACRKDAKTCDRVRQYLRRLMRSYGIADATVSAYASSDDQVSISNAHGETTDRNWRASLSGYIQPSDYLLLGLGALAYDNPNADNIEVIPVGSLLSFGFEYAQVDIGYRDRWLSPLIDSSMLIGTQAPTMASVGISNYTPLSPLGINYDLFIARMHRQDGILSQGNRVSGRPRLAGVHLGIEPADGWSLGVNRLLQYGGGPRRKSARDLFDAFFNPSERDNASAALDPDAEFGNQVASFTSRFVFPGAHPFSVYFEYAGEDTSKNKNYRLGNSALSAGIYIPNVAQRFDLTYEVSEWQNGWYVHGIYGEGLTNNGHVLGHWGAARRAMGDVGAQTHLLRIGALELLRGTWDLSYRSIQNEDYSSIDYERGHEVTARYSLPTRYADIAAEGAIGRDPLGERYWRIGASVQYGAGRQPGDLQSIDDPSDSRADGAELFVDTGINVSRVRIDLTDYSFPVQTTDARTDIHVALGARRAVAGRHDLGVRIEGDRVNEELLIGVRALDYRYRLGASLAFTAFLGAARYELLSPAYGYYGGVGAQWRNLWRDLDLNLDFRYYDALARDKFDSGEFTPGFIRPDTFHDIRSLSVSASYRF